MSRNIRHKFPRSAPAKAAKRRGSDSSSSLNLSDDDGYSGVDEVSDSEDDDEEGVYAAEEEHIIRETQKRRKAASPRPEQEDDEDADEEDDDDDADEDDDDDDEENQNADDNDDDDDDEEDLLLDDNHSWNGIASDDEQESQFLDASAALTAQETPAVKRQVRFAGVPDSDSDSTTSETSEIASFFPDIFVEQTSLDPAFRRELEQDPDDGSSNSSFWDFYDTYGQFGSDGAGVVLGTEEGAETPKATDAAGHAATADSARVPSPDVDDSQDHDGYESDGDTTEEDTPEPPARRKQARRVQPVDNNSESDTDRPTKSRRGKPRVGRFNLDSADNKPVAVMHPKTGKMIIFTPNRSRNLDLSPGTLGDLGFFMPPPPNTTQSSPILTHSRSLMMGAMLSSQTFGDFMQPQHFGPEEAFFPSFNSDAIMGEDSDFSGPSDEDDEDEMNLKIDDFIDFGNSTDDDRGGPDEEATPKWADDTDAETPASTPCRRPSTATTAISFASEDIVVHPLLAHFDSNAEAVGAFRRNQVNQQLILSEKATSESLAFSSPYSMGTLRGIKDGRLENVTAPLTPARKQKRGYMNGLEAYSRSPLEAASQKRKASGLAGESSHKRHRSISDVGALTLDF